MDTAQLEPLTLCHYILSTRGGILFLGCWMFGPDNSHHLSASAKAANRNIFCSEDPDLMQ